MRRPYGKYVDSVGVWHAQPLHGALLHSHKSFAIANTPNPATFSFALKISLADFLIAKIKNYFLYIDYFLYLCGTEKMTANKSIIIFNQYVRLGDGTFC